MHKQTLGQYLFCPNNTAGCVEYRYVQLMTMWKTHSSCLHGWYKVTDPHATKLRRWRFHPEFGGGGVFLTLNYRCWGF